MCGAWKVVGRKNAFLNPCMPVNSLFIIQSHILVLHTHHQPILHITHSFLPTSVSGESEGMTKTGHSRYSLTSWQFYITIIRMRSHDDPFTSHACDSQEVDVVVCHLRQTIETTISAKLTSLPLLLHLPACVYSAVRPGISEFTEKIPSQKLTTNV